jgi:hypothetical protein
LVRIAVLFEERSQQSPSLAAPGSLTALPEIIRNIHRRCLVLDGAPDLRVQMRDLTLDI